MFGAGEEAYFNERLFGHEAFMDGDFMRFAREYLCAVVEDFENADWKLRNKLLAAAVLTRSPLEKVHWEELESNYHFSNNNICFGTRTINDFLAPLRFIYKQRPGILESRMSHFRLGKKKNKDRRRKNKVKKTTLYDRKTSFDDFANGYLREFFEEVVHRSDDGCTCNMYLWKEMKEAFQAVRTKVDFSDSDLWEGWKKITRVDVHVGNPKVGILIAPLRYLYESVHPNRLRQVANDKCMAKPRAKVLRSQAPWPDLELVPEETLHIISFPVEVRSKIEKSSFLATVMRLMTHCLQWRHTWVSSPYLADTLRVDRREFEEWADQCDQLLSGTSRDGNMCYRLPPFDKGVFAMSTEPTTPGGPATDPHSPTCQCGGCPAPVGSGNGDSSQGSSATTTTQEISAAGGVTIEVPESEEEILESQIAAHPDIGTDEFDTLITRVLSDDSVLWRSSDAVVALGYDAEKFHEWAIGSPMITNRISSRDDKKRFYALYNRLEAITPEDKKKDEKEEKQRKVDAASTADEKKKKDKKPQAPSITQQELFALAMLHRSCDDMIRIMNFYANGLATRHSEAFAHFTKAQSAYSAGVALLQKGLKIQDKKLPSLEDI